MHDTQRSTGAGTDTTPPATPQPWREHQPPGLMNTLGPLLSRREGDGWAYGLRIDERHLNPAGMVHGGTLTALMDHALSAIAWSGNDKAPCVTVQLNMNFLSAARAGATLVARGRITQQGGSLIFMEGSVHDGGACMATAQAVMKRLADRKGG